MENNIETINILSDPCLTSSLRRLYLRKFVQEFGWRPSDVFDELPGTETYTNGHLLVEHGLNNSAVITFSKGNRPFSSLDHSKRLSLLEISYNNLVDWHFFTDLNGLTVVYNRTEPYTYKYISTYEEPDLFHSDTFDKITAIRPNPNIKSLDDALIETLSMWKRMLAMELGREIRNEDISSLFNSILFVRAIEDNNRWKKPNTNELLIEAWNENGASSKSIKACIYKSLKKLDVQRPHKSLLDIESLQIFDNLDKYTVNRLFSDFYNNRFAPYKYDFSLMSKHALSRIYERYVSLLREKDTAQLMLFPDLPEEIDNRTLGSIYTPQYIARFFARFLRENLTPAVFRKMHIADPACGSGIFLRTILEMQCDPFQDINIEVPSENAFQNILGVDIDINACHATKLSLALLHLVLTNKLPSKDIPIMNDEIISYFTHHPGVKEVYDAVIANPPFIKWDAMSDDMKIRVQTFMGGISKGKIDMYLASLKIGLEMVKPGGYLLFVLPHSFLKADNARILRKYIRAHFTIKIMADLSEIPVFENVGTYVILLILQKQQQTEQEATGSKAIIVNCKEFVGHALQDALEGKQNKTDFYNIYEVDQTQFSENEWNIVPIKLNKLQGKLSKFKTLDEYLVIREGFVTGADDIFIRNAAAIPQSEKAIYQPYLSDREMMKYIVPNKTDRVVFYPYIDNERISETDIHDKFPLTWSYLSEHKNKLEIRKSVLSNRCEWWSPVWPRPPENMLRPKIISPHLILMTRFSFDEKGKYAVSRCPLMYPRISINEHEYLRYFLGILNSSIAFWQIKNLSHKYSRGYIMLEPKTLNRICVPDPSSISKKTMNRLLELVGRCIGDSDFGIRDMNADEEIDSIVADLYGLTRIEKDEIGL